MAQAFNFTANLNVQLNSLSLRSVQSELNAGLKGLNVQVGVAISPSAQTSLNNLNATVVALSNNLKVLQANAVSAATALNSMAASLGRFGGGASTAVSATANVTTAVRSTSAAFKASGDQAEYFGHQMRLSTQRFIGFTVAVGGMMTVVRAFREAMGEAINFERQMTKINQVSTETPGVVAAIGQEVGRVSVQWGVSSKELVKVAEQLKQTGLSARDVKAAMEPLAKASLAPSFGDMAKTTQGAIAATRQFGIEIKDLEGTLGSINAVASGFAVESNDIIEAIKKAGGAFKAAGGNLHEFIATFTAVRATTRESAETIATGLRTIFTRLQRPEAIESLRSLGIQLQHTRREAEQMGNLNLEGKFVGPMEAIRRISQQLKGMSSTDPRFMAIAEEAGGYRQIAQVIPLIQQQRLAQDALNTSIAGGNSLTTAAEKTQGALFTQIEKVHQELLQLGRDILASPGFRAFIVDALKLASSLIAVLDVAKPLLPVLMGFAAIKIGQNIGSIFAGLGRGPLPGRYHSGGHVQGSGEQPAILQGGEYVFNRQTVKRVGRSTLDRMNFAEGDEVPALLALRRDPRMKNPSREDARLLTLQPKYQAAATRYANQKIALLEADSPPVFAAGPRATIEGILFERYVQKHLKDFNPQAGLDFPNLDTKSRANLAKLTGQDVSNISGVELKRTATARNLAETVRKAGFAEGGHVDARVMPGEYIFTPEESQKIGVNRLRRLNDYGKFATGGLVPGSGSTDSVAMALPAGSFVIKKRVVEKVGAGSLHDMAQRYGSGGPVHFSEGGGDEVRQHEVPYRSVKADLNFADVQRAANEFGITLKDTTRVLVEYRTVVQERRGHTVTTQQATFAGFPEQRVQSGEGALSFEQLRAVHGKKAFKKETVLPPELQHVLIGRNLGHLRTAIKSKYGQALGDDAESNLDEMIMMGARTFDPTEDKKNQFTAQDVAALPPQRAPGEGPTKIDKNFMNRVHGYVKGRLTKDFAKLGRERSAGGGEEYAGGVYAGGQRDIPDMLADRELREQYGSVEEGRWAVEAEDEKKRRRRRPRQAAQEVVRDQPAIDRTPTVPRPAGLPGGIRMEDVLRQQRLPADFTTVRELVLGQRGLLGQRGDAPFVPPPDEMGPPPPPARPGSTQKFFQSRAVVPYVSPGPTGDKVFNRQFWAGPDGTVYPYDPNKTAVDKYRGLLEDRRKRRYSVAQDREAMEYQDDTLAPEFHRRAIDEARAQGAGRYSEINTNIRVQRQRDLLDTDQAARIAQTTREQRARDREVTDPLARRAALRAQGVTLGAEYADVLETNREGAERNRRRYGNFPAGAPSPAISPTPIQPYGGSGTQALRFDELAGFARQAGMTTQAFVELSNEARGMAGVLEGTKRVVVQTEGGFARIIGTQANPVGTQLNPSRQDALNRAAVLQAQLNQGPSLGALVQEQLNKGPLKGNEGAGVVTGDAAGRGRFTAPLTPAPTVYGLKGDESWEPRPRRRRRVARETYGVRPDWHTNEIWDEELRTIQDDREERARSKGEYSPPRTRPVPGSRPYGVVLEGHNYVPPPRPQNADALIRRHRRQLDRTQGTEFDDAQDFALAEQSGQLSRMGYRRVGFEDVAKQRAEQEFGRLGGANQLTEANRTKILDEQRKRLSSEVLYSQADVLQARQKGLTREEAVSMASEQMSKAEQERQNAPVTLKKREVRERAAFLEASEGLGQKQALSKARSQLREEKRPDQKVIVDAAGWGVTGGDLGSFAQLREGYQSGFRTNSYSQQIRPEDLARQRADREVARLGGPAMVSQQTQENLLNTQKQRLDQEVIAVTQRQIQALNKGISSAEARNLATEQHTRALKEGTRVLVDSNGRSIGYGSNVNAMEAAGLRVTGRNALGEWGSNLFGGIGQRVGAASAGLRNWNDRMLAPVGGQFGFNMMMMMGGTAASYGANLVDRSAGTAENAVANKGEIGYQRSKMGSGLLTGALTGGAIGATLGSIIPGGTLIGAGVGGLIGGLSGVVVAMQDAEKEIRQVKIQNAMTEFTDKLGILASQMPTEYVSQTVNSALESLKTARTIGSEKSRDEATSFWGGLGEPLGLGKRFDPLAYAAQEKKETRQEFGSQIPQINQLLSRQVEQMAGRNPNGKAQGIADDLLVAQNGLNRELLSIVATIRGVPLKQVMDDLVKQIQEAQRNARAAAEVRTGQMAENRNVAAFGRLASAVEAAAYSLDDLQNKAKVTSEVFAGQLAATRVSANTDVLGDVATPNRLAYREAAGTVAAGTGEAGLRFQQAGEAANQVANLLPTILSNVVSTNPLQQEDFTQATRRQLYSQMGYSESKEAPEQIQRTVEAALGQLRHLKPDEIIKETQTDVTKLTDRLLAPMIGPLKEAGQRAGKALEAEANRFVQGLTDATKMMNEIGANRDRLSQIQLAGVRQSVQFRQQEEGRRNQGVNDIPLATLELPGQQRQERLTGIAGPAANSPELISRRLAEVRQQVQMATARQQEVFNATGGKGPGFEAAASDLVRLRDQAVRLQDALRHLADASERNAGAQEKLQSIERDRESRLGFAERFIRGGDEERVSMQRGLILANAANQQGSIRGYSNEDQRLVIDTLSGLGQAKLTGFAGQPNAADLKENLLRDFLGPKAEMDQANRAAEKELKQVITDNFQKAAEAQQGLITHQQELHGTFFSTLQQAHTTFLRELGAALANERLGDKRSQLGQQGVEVQKLKGLTGQRDLLGQAGIKTDDQLASLKAALPDIEKLEKARADIREVGRKRAEVMPAVGDIYDKTYGGLKNNFINARYFEHTAFDTESQRKLTDQLTTKYGFTGKESSSVLEQFQANVREKIGKRADFNETKIGEHETVLRQSLANAIREISNQAMAEAEKGGLSEARKSLTDRGLNVRGLEGVLGDKGEGLGKLKDAMGAFDGTNAKLDGFQGKLDDATRTFTSLNEAVKNLETTVRGAGGAGAAAGGRFGFAEGGLVPNAPNGVPGRPQGTDTVPAWLTPGEMIVSVASTRANRQLLEHINASKGPVRLAKGGVAYLAEGGEVPNQDDALEKSSRADILKVYDASSEAARKEMFGNFLRTMGTDNVYALRTRFEDKDTWSKIPGDWRGYISAYLAVFERENAKKLAEAKGDAEAFRNDLFMPKGPPQDIAPAEATRRENAAYQENKKRYEDQKGLYAKNSPDQMWLEEVLKLEGNKDVMADRDRANILSPEQRGKIRAVRELQAAYMAKQAEAAGNVEVAGAGVVRDEKFAQKTDLFRGQAEIMTDAAAGIVRDSYANMKSFEERKAFFDDKKGWLNPEYAKTRKEMRDKFSPVDNAKYDVFLQQYQSFLVEKAAQEAQQRQQGQANQQAQNQQKANDQFKKDQPEVEDQLKRQAIADPGGSAAQIMLGRAVQAMQTKRRQLIQQKQGLNKEQAEKLTLQEQTELSQILAANYYGNQVTTLRSRQRMAHFGGSPLAGFGLSLPGMEGQQAIAGGALARQDEGRRKARNPGWDEFLRKGRAAAAGAQRLPFDPNRPPPRAFAEGGLVPGGFTGAVDDVPAQLTRGEYVLSRPAVQAIGVAAVERLHFLAKGGQVQHLAGGGFAGGPPSTSFTSGGTTGGGDGGLAAALTAFNGQAGNLSGALNSFGQSSQALAQAFNAFGSSAGGLTQALSNFPSKVTHEGQFRHEIVFNGAEVLARLQDGLQTYIADQIDATLNAQFKQRLPDA